MAKFVKLTIQGMDFTINADLISGFWQSSVAHKDKGGFSTGEYYTDIFFKPDSDAALIKAMGTRTLHDIHAESGEPMLAENTYEDINKQLGVK